MTAVRNVFAIVEKEWRHYFGSPIAWVALAVCSLLFGIFFSLGLSFFVRQSASMQASKFAPKLSLNDYLVRPVLQNMAVVALFVAPMLTMRLFAEERRQGTIVLLATSPLSDLQIVIGKFVQTVYQVHSGPVLGSNCAGLMHLLRGLDPRWVGTYPDFGHMVLDGEDYPMGLAMIREYLSIVGLKDAYHAPQPAGSEPPFVPRFVKLGDGAVNWRRALGALKALGFDEAFSVHTEYNFDEPIIRQVGYADATPPHLEEWAQADAAFLRRMWKDATGC